MTVQPLWVICCGTTQTPSPQQHRDGSCKTNMHTNMSGISHPHPDGEPVRWRKSLGYKRKKMIKKQNTNKKTKQQKKSDSMGASEQRSAQQDCLHFRSRTSFSKDVEKANTLARGGLSVCSAAATASVSSSKLGEQCSWTSSSDSTDSEANLLRIKVLEAVLSIPQIMSTSCWANQKTVLLVKVLHVIYNDCLRK